MRKIIISILVATFVIGMSIPSYASDWDKAGKAFAAIEGLRILTGGNVDIVGSIAGINRDIGHPRYGRHKRRRYSKAHHRCSGPAWVPHYRWKKKYISKHKEYDEKYGEIIVEGHYIKYKVEKGGEWVSRRNCDW